MKRRVGSNEARPPSAGPRLHSKGTQLADYLKRAIEAGNLIEPLPGLRLWSRQLGVSRRTLNSAIQELQRQNWVTIHRRGVRLAAPRDGKRERRIEAPRRVHLLFYGAYRLQIHSYLETTSALQEQLRLRGLELKWEICTPARLREIARQTANSDELLLLASVPPSYQRLFAASGKPTFVLGEVALGVSLPFVNVDQAGAVRHAAFRLLRHGFRELVFVHVNVDAAGIRSAVAAFRVACAEWPQQPVAAQTVATSLDPTSLALSVRRLAEGVRGRKGIIVAAPVPIGMVVTALLHYGIALPRQAEVMAVFHSAETVKLYPPPTCYPFPMRKVVKHVSDVAARFFETRQLPSVRQTLSPEMA